MAVRVRSGKVELLGRGGMGEVWRAYDPAHERFVALKVLPATIADDAVLQERFRREILAAAGPDEPHVVPIYDSGEIDGRLFVSMRLVKGHDLSELVREGPLPSAAGADSIPACARVTCLRHADEFTENLADRWVHAATKPTNGLSPELPSAES